MPMQFDRQDLLAFYAGVDYWPGCRQLRPREMHTPKFIYKFLIDEEIKPLENSKLERKLKTEECRQYAAVRLHEALFHYYKAFYNYLAARKLYYGGMSHWLSITTYYAKFYLARCITTLAGCQAYQVNNTECYFLEKIDDLLDSKERNRQTGQKATSKEQNSKPKRYRIYTELDILKRNACITIDKEPVSSHQDVWKYYDKLPIKSLGIYPLKYDMSDYSPTKERNEENYSFEGYADLDFNLDPESFQNGFKCYSIKNRVNTIYDERTGPVLLTLASCYRLFREMEIKALPIEREKHLFMIDFCLPDGKFKENLLLLCNSNFDIDDLFPCDGDLFYDNQGRFFVNVSERYRWPLW